MTDSLIAGPRAVTGRLARHLHRLALRLSYPLLCRLERVFELRSDVAMVAVWHDGRLLTVRHSYRPGDALPGGTLSAGEAPARAAARELFEEVGIDLRPEDLVLVRSWQERRGRRWLFDYHPADLPQITPDQREVVSARFIAAHEIPARLRRILGPRMYP